MLMTMPLDPALLLTTASRYSSNRRALRPPSLGRWPQPADETIESNKSFVIPSLVGYLRPPPPRRLLHAPRLPLHRPLAPTIPRPRPTDGPPAGSGTPGR